MSGPGPNAGGPKHGHTPEKSRPIGARPSCLSSPSVTRKRWRACSIWNLPIRNRAPRRTTPISSSQAPGPSRRQRRRHWPPDETTSVPPSDMSTDRRGRTPDHLRRRRPRARSGWSGLPHIAYCARINLAYPVNAYTHYMLGASSRRNKVRHRSGPSRHPRFRATSGTR